MECVTNVLTARAAVPVTHTLSLNIRWSIDTRCARRRHLLTHSDGQPPYWCMQRATIERFLPSDCYSKLLLLRAADGLVGTLSCLSPSAGCLTCIVCYDVICLSYDDSVPDVLTCPFDHTSAVFV